MKGNKVKKEEEKYAIIPNIKIYLIVKKSYYKSYARMLKMKRKKLSCCNLKVEWALFLLKKGNVLWNINEENY